MIWRACAIVRRGDRILVFRHPLAGVQLVKGRLHRAERPKAAALRELREESGISGFAATLLGRVRQPELGQLWVVFDCKTRPLPDTWTYHAPDDGGHIFRFFWHPLHENLDGHAAFERVRQFIAKDAPPPYAASSSSDACLCQSEA